MSIAGRVKSPSRREPIAPDINVTPLVDVVLVLLIIFMVIAPALEHGERVELPSVMTPDKQPKSALDPVTVTVGASGAIFLEKEPIERAELTSRLSAIHAAEPERRVVLKGDGTVGYEKVRELFERVQGAGFSGVSLMVSKRKGRDDEASSDEH